MKSKNYSRLIYILVPAIVVLFSGVVSAENCLDTWLLDNSRNMTANPGFEGSPDFSGWSISTNPQGVTTIIDETNSNNGDRSVKVTWDGNSQSQNYWHTSQTFNVIPGRTYRVNGYIKTAGVYCDNPVYASWNGIRIFIYDPDHPYQTEGYWSADTGSLYGTNDWTKLTAEFTVPDYSSRIKLQLRRFVGWQSGPSYGSAWWDDIQLLPVPRIYDLNITASEITINGESFGVDPGPGNRSTDNNCVLYEGVCLPESSVRSWSDNTIVIDNAGDGVMSVRSGGIASNAMIEQPHSALANNTLSLYFPNVINGDGIGQITDTSAGMQFIDDSIAIKPLYEFTVKETPFTISKTIISSRDASVITKHYSEENGLKTLTITANHCDEFTVTAVVVLPSDQGGARFSIDVQNHGNRVVQSVRYPIVAAKATLGSDASDDAIVIPYFEGYLYKNPASLSSSTSYKDMDYPGGMTIQMMAYYDSGQPNAGLYLSSNDSEGHKKRFGFEKINNGLNNYIVFSFLHVTPEAAGNQLSVPYEVLIDTFAGDWYDAADKYKQWALTQPWTSIKLADRDDVPGFLYDIKTMIDCYACPHEDYVYLVDHYEDILGVSDILIYPGGFWGTNEGYKDGFFYTDSKGNQQPARVSWSGIDYFTDNPVYDPAEAANPPFGILKTAIDDLRDRGSDVLLFIEGGRSWDRYFFKLSNNYPGLETCSVIDQSTVIPEELKIFDDRPHYYAYGDPYVTINENGADRYALDFAYPEMINEYCRMNSTICVGSDAHNAMDVVLYNAIERGIDHGARLMSLDGLVSGNIYGCWDPDHGHPIGEGKWTHDRYMSILNDVRDIVISKGKYGEFGLAMEYPHELYLPYLQMQYLRHSDLTSKGNKKIPLFNYIYKEYYIGLERGMSLDSGNSLDIRWSLGIDFIQGHIQGTMVRSDPAYQPDADLVAFYTRLINMKSPELYKAKMLHPPAFSGLPAETTITRNNKTYFIDPVLTNVLKTDDGAIRYLLVNSFTDGSGEYAVQFDAGQYDLPSNRVNIKIIKNSVEIDNLQDALLPLPISVSLNGGDVVEVRVEHWDIDGDGLNNNKEVLFGTDPYKNDTDDDGVTDYIEVCYDGDCDNYAPHPSGNDLNALSQDTDNDGISDGGDNCPFVLPVKLDDMSYSTLYDAYSEASEGAVILGQAEQLIGDLNIDIDKTVTFKGGYDCNYTSSPGRTMLKGTLSINDGTVTIQAFIIGN